MHGAGAESCHPGRKIIVLADAASARSALDEQCVGLRRKCVCRVPLSMGINVANLNIGPKMEEEWMRRVYGFRITNGLAYASRNSVAPYLFAGTSSVPLTRKIH